MHMQRHNSYVLAPWGLGEGSKGQLSLNFIYTSISKIFFNYFLYVFSQMKDKKTYQREFSFGRLGHATGVCSYVQKHVIEAQ